MKKLRSDALWHTFTPDQQKQIEHWLFADHLSYQQTRNRMKTELGLTCAFSTMHQIHRYLSDVRADSAFLTAHDVASEVVDSGVRLEKLRAASELLLASRFLRAVTAKAPAHEIATLGRLMLQHQSRDIRRTQADLAAEYLKLKASPSASRPEPSPTGYQPVASDTKPTISDT